MNSRTASSASAPRYTTRRRFLTSTLGATASLVTACGPSRRSRRATTAAPRSTDVRIADVTHAFEEHRYRTPLKFGGVPSYACTLLNVTVRVERADGRLAEGFGSMPLGNVWSFPPRYVPPDQSLAAMKRLADAITPIVRAYTLRDHPIEIFTQIEPAVLRQAETLSHAMDLPRPIPKLCTLVVLSAFDAAIHDAYGKVNGVNVYNALGRDYVHHDLAQSLDARFTGKYLDAYTLRRPKPTMPLYHLVGALDPITDADVKERIDDGLPETLGEWIERDGLTHLKIKLNGDDVAWDVQRVLAVDRTASQVQKRRGVERWVYSVDFNERCANVDYVIEFFRRVREGSAAAFERIHYAEQPTDRDLEAHPENKMHAAAKIKPVVIDESLVDYESLRLAREQGYSGVALKACKGLSAALLMAAAALEFKMFLTVQDLTCPGASFLQSAELAARVPTVAAIEGNARQYCPAANEAWATRYPGLFVIRDGTVETGALTKPGLGH